MPSILSHQPCLQCYYSTSINGIDSVALDWFRSYLAGRMQYVLRGSALSSIVYLTCCVHHVCEHVYETKATAIDRQGQDQESKRPGPESQGHRRSYMLHEYVSC